jgi:hypothetical protein
MERASEEVAQADEDYEEFLAGQKPTEALLTRLKTTKEQLRSAVQVKWQNKQVTDRDCKLIAAVLTSFTSYTVSPMMGVFSLDHNEIGDEGLCFIAEALQIPNGITSQVTGLWLNNNRIGDDGTAALAQALKNGGMVKLQKLYLHDNLIGDDGAAALADAIINSSGVLDRLRFLYLSNNNITARGRDVLMAAVGKLNRIQVSFDDGRPPSPVSF